MPGATGSSCSNIWLPNGFQGMDPIGENQLVMVTGRVKVGASADWLVLGEE